MPYTSMCVYTHRVTNSNVSKPSDVPKPLKKFTDTTLLATNRVLELQPTLPSTLLQGKKGEGLVLPPHTPILAIFSDTPFPKFPHC